MLEASKRIHIKPVYSFALSKDIDLVWVVCKDEGVLFCVR